MLHPQNIEQLEGYFRKEKIFDMLGINRIGVFGSFARAEAFNDIDLLIEDDVPAEILIRFQNKLTKDIHTSIDIVISKFAEPVILLHAKKDVKYARRQ